MAADESTRVRDEVTAFCAAGRIDEAQALFDCHKNGLPEQVRLECVGNIHFYRRELQEAVRQYEAAIRLAPERPIARYQYLVGTQEERKKRYEEAFKRYQYAIEIEPAFVDVYVEMGGLLVRVGDFAGAAQCYRDAVRLAPDDPANQFNLRVALGKLAELEPERYGDELAACENALERALSKSPLKPLERYRW